jgi:hypothetical protein
MIDILVAILTAFTLVVMGELCRWAWRVHDRNNL